MLACPLASLPQAQTLVQVLGKGAKDRGTSRGELRRGELFVAVLGVSCITHAEPSDLSWIGVARDGWRDRRGYGKSAGSRAFGGRLQGCPAGGVPGDRREFTGPAQRRRENRQPASPLRRLDRGVAADP